MSSRVSCWLHGQRWGKWDKRTWENIIGNRFKVRWCEQCGAHQSVCTG